MHGSNIPRVRLLLLPCSAVLLGHKNSSPSSSACTNHLSINSVAIHCTCGSCRMVSLGRFTNALGVVHNENTLALMNMNFDFSLFRVDAPIEFQALGNKIFRKRRQEGELRRQHRTARRLGAFFEGVLPPIPKFSRAYGLRIRSLQMWRKLLV